MIKIHKSTAKHTKGQFYVTYSAKNGKVLTVSETVKTFRSALKNVKAMAGVFWTDRKQVIRIVDCTGDKKKVIAI